MSLTYADVGSLIFGEREFTSREFESRIGSGRAAMLLSELHLRGLVSREGRGRYRFLRPSERPDLRAAEWKRLRAAILGGPEPKAWDGASAVEVWTDGAYRVAPSPFLRIYHVVVPRRRLPVWRAYLRSHAIAVNGRKRVGGRVALRGVDRLRRVTLDGEPVIPRDNVVALIRDHPGIFADAEELIRGGP